MKANISKLLVTIVLMGAVYASAGQPARGSQDDNRGNQKEKKETLKPEKNNFPSHNIKFKGEQRPVPKELSQRDIKYREATRADNKSAAVNRDNHSGKVDYRDVRRMETARNYHPRASAARVKIPQHFHGNRHYYYTPKYGHTLRYLHSAVFVHHSAGFELVTLPARYPIARPLIQISATF